jgi:6,7-dimethyl-8-ribityllumazine synthase
MLSAVTNNPIFDGSAKRVGIVVARFNQAITDALLASAKSYLADCGVPESSIAIISVAGCGEVPFALQKLAKTKQFDCLVALGCVIRGETPHFDYVCKMVQEGVLQVSLDESIPVGFAAVFGWQKVDLG